MKNGQYINFFAFFFYKPVFIEEAGLDIDMRPCTIRPVDEL
jgi:hypothetical protein